MARNHVQKGSLAKLTEDFEGLKTFVCNDLAHRVKSQGRMLYALVALITLTLAVIGITLALVAINLAG